MDSILLERFIGIVGENNYYKEEDSLAPYLVERRGKWKGRAALVLLPGNKQEVSAIMELANTTKTPVVPQGGNTGLVGGQIPDETGKSIVVSLSRMNKIYEIDTLSNTVTVESGVILEHLRRVVDSAGRLFPLSLASRGSCQIGGNLASNAGGVSTLAYGCARDLCLGIEVVLPTGEIFEDLSKLKKDNTGYDLKNLFIGSEGTLGIITAAVLKIFPKPKSKETAWIPFHSLEDVLRFLDRVHEYANVFLTSFELMNRNVVEIALRHFPDLVSPSGSDFPWYVLLEVSSCHAAEETCTVMHAMMQQAIEKKIISTAFIASSLRQSQEYWKIREILSEAQKREGVFIKHDVSLPIDKIAVFIERAEKEIKKMFPDACIVCFGHLGDGSLHYNVMQSQETRSKDFVEKSDEMNAIVYDIVRLLGGSISAEHGIGQLKRREILNRGSAVTISLMRRIKHTLDPEGIMNPGKVL